MDEACAQDEPQLAVEAWIVGSGTASLASAVYLVQRAKLLPHNVHVLDSHISMGAALHHNGDSVHGYDQFAGCLPVPVGSPLEELLASIPSEQSRGCTVLDEIKKKEASHMPADHNCGTKFLIQNSDSRESISPKGLGLSVKCRMQLALLMLRSEKSLKRIRIQDFMSSSFFQSSFWVVWTAQ
jgi:oleate hydratase